MITKIVIYVSGGLIQSIGSNNPDVQIKLLDFDEFDNDVVEPFEDRMFYPPDYVASDEQIEVAGKGDWDEEYEKNKRL